MESGNGVKSGGEDSTLVAGWKRGEGRRAVIDLVGSLCFRNMFLSAVCSEKNDSAYIFHFS